MTISLWWKEIYVVIQILFRWQRLRRAQDNWQNHGHLQCYRSFDHRVTLNIFSSWDYIFRIRALRKLHGVYELQASVWIMIPTELLMSTFDIWNNQTPCPGLPINKITFGSTSSKLCVCTRPTLLLPYQFSHWLRRRATSVRIGREAASELVQEMWCPSKYERWCTNSIQ